MKFYGMKLTCCLLLQWHCSCHIPHLVLCLCCFLHGFAFSLLLSLLRNVFPPIAIILQENQYSPHLHAVHAVDAPVAIVLTVASCRIVARCSLDSLAQ